MENIKLAVTYNNIGNVYKNLGELNNVLEYYQKSLELHISHYGEDHMWVFFYFFILWLM